MEEIIKKLEDRVELCKRFDGNLDSVSWGYEEGVLISANEAAEVAHALKEYMRLFTKPDLLTIDDKDYYSATVAADLAIKYVIELDKRKWLKINEEYKHKFNAEKES